jgi:hypothetical protein
MMITKNHGMLVVDRSVAIVVPAAVPINPGERSNSPKITRNDTAMAKKIKSTMEFKILVIFRTRRYELFGEKYQKKTIISNSKHNRVNVLLFRNFLALPAISIVTILRFRSNQ